VTEPTDLVSRQAQILVHFAALPSVSLSKEERAAMLEGARLLEREARAKAFDQRDDQ
jgi:hypothetical protein